jgi:hypothetical protein
MSSVSAKDAFWGVNHCQLHNADCSAYLNEAFSKMHLLDPSPIDFWSYPVGGLR